MAKQVQAVGNKTKLRFITQAQAVYQAIVKEMRG